MIYHKLIFNILEIQIYICNCTYICHIIYYYTNIIAYYYIVYLTRLLLHLLYSSLLSLVSLFYFACTMAAITVDEIVEATKDRFFDNECRGGVTGVWKLYHEAKDVVPVPSYRSKASHTQKKTFTAALDKLHELYVDRPKPSREVEVPANSCWLGSSNFHERSSLASGDAVFLPAIDLTQNCMFSAMPGCGKTVGARVVLEELLLQEHLKCAIVFDNKGDLVQMAKQFRDEGEGSARESSFFRNRDLQERNRKFEDEVEVKIYTPGNTMGLGLTFDPLRFPNKADFPDDTEEDFECYCDDKCAELADALVTFLLPDGKAREKAQTTASIKVLLDQIRLKKSTQAERVKNMSDFADFIQLSLQNNSRANIGTEAKLHLVMEEIRILLCSKIGQLLFADSDNVRLFPATMDTFLKRKDPRKKRTLNIIYTGHLHNLNYKRILAYLVCREVNSFLQANPPDFLRPEIAVFIDEAKIYCHNQAATTSSNDGEDLSTSLSGIHRNASELPASGHCLIVASQLPEDIHKKVSGNCANRFFGTLRDNHLGKASKMLSTKSRPLFKKIANLSKPSSPENMLFHPYLFEGANNVGTKLFFREPFRFFIRTPTPVEDIKAWKLQYQRSLAKPSNPLRLTSIAGTRRGADFDDDRDNYDHDGSRHGDGNENEEEEEEEDSGRAGAKRYKQGGR